jgi:hypothetical protein
LKGGGVVAEGNVVLKSHKLEERGSRINWLYLENKKLFEGNYSTENCIF